MPKTAYARAMDDVRKEKKRKARRRKGNNATRIVGRCGARTRRGTICGNPKGFGTTHYGIGACKYHGGSTPSSNKAAARKTAIMMGAPLEINPLDALIWCIKITAGEVEFCTTQLELLEKDEWLEHTLVGKQVHVWAKERQKATERLAKFSKDALALGIAERAVRLAEQYGSSIAKYTKGLFEDLELTPDQQKRAPLIVRKHLALLEGSGPITDKERREPLPAIPRRVS